MYIFSITYNFNDDYVTKKCDTYEEAFDLLKKYLEQEIQTVEKEEGYKPSVIHWDRDDDITLVYAEGYNEDISRYHALENCANYRIFEIK